MAWVYVVLPYFHTLNCVSNMIEYVFTLRVCSHFLLTSNRSFVCSLLLSVFSSPYLAQSATFLRMIGPPHLLISCGFRIWHLPFSGYTILQFNHFQARCWSSQLVGFAHRYWTILLLQFSIQPSASVSGTKRFLSLHRSSTGRYQMTLLRTYDLPVWCVRAHTCIQSHQGLLTTCVLCR